MSRTKNKRTAVFRNLKIKIALVCCLLTGIVLCGACVFAYRIAADEVITGQEKLFSAQCQTVNAYLVSSDQLDREAMLRFAKENKLLIAVNDNGKLLQFAPDISQDQFTAMLAAVQATPEGKRFSQPPQAMESVRFEPVIEGQQYSAMLFSNRYGFVKWTNALVLQKALNITPQLLRLRWVYTLIFLAGAAVLAVVSLLIARHVVRPAERSQAEQLRFLASASHELKSPLAVISSSVDVLKRGIETPENQLEIIQQQAHRMADLVDDMLILTNSGTARWSLRTAPVSPADLLLDVYEAYEALFAQNGQTLTVQLPEHSPGAIQADEQRIKQILGIFLDNARSYAKSSKTVELVLQQAGSQLKFSVIDHGKGVPDQEKKQIFSYFYHSAQPEEAGLGKERKPGHYGLGLAVAAELALLNNGRLEVSDTPGGGASFALLVPMD